MREKKVYKSLPGYVTAIVIEPFDSYKIGDVVELCDRRYKSLSNRKKVRMYES
jgi:hypothetical protein